MDALELFRSLDPALKRRVMAHAVELLAVTDDLSTVVDVLMYMAEAT